MRQVVVSFCCLIFVISACRQVKDPSISWSVRSMNPYSSLKKKELIYTRKLQAEQLYIPLFDVDFHQDLKNAIPLSSHRLKKKDSLLHLAPVISVSDRVFSETDSADLTELPQLIAQRLVRLTDSLEFQEVLFDCDWTPKNKDKYFKLLQDFRSFLPYSLRKLSATVSLHYFRYADTVGIPPVDKIQLRLVNQLELDSINHHGKPLDINLLKPYLMAFNAFGPEVEIGIPFGNWGILIRKKQPLRFFPTITMREIKKQGEFVEIDDNGNNKMYVKVEENAYFQEEYLQRGDIIRIQSYNNSSIKALWPMLKEFSRNDTLSVCLLNIEEDFEDKYPSDMIRGWFQPK